MTRARGLRVVAISLLGLILLPATGTAQEATGSQTYSTPGEHAFTVPAGVTSLQVTLIGGNGGAGRFPGSAGGAGGQGATVNATLAVTAGETLFAEVAGNGETGSSEGEGQGGAGGGGRGGEIFLAKGGGGGGGASDLRTCGLKCGGSSLSTRLIVAGGGGGGGGEGSPTAVNGGSGGMADRSATSGSRNSTLQGGEGGRRATTSGGGANGAFSYECPTLASCASAGTEGAGGTGGGGSTGGGGGGGGGGVFGGGGGGGGEGFEISSLSYENGGGGGGGGGSSGVPAAGAGRVSGFAQLLTMLGAEPSIVIAWTIPVSQTPAGSPSPPAGVTGPVSTGRRTSALTSLASISNLTVTPTRFRRGRHTATLSAVKPKRRTGQASTGTTISFDLSNPAKVTLSFDESLAGAIVARRCVARSKSHRRGHACTLHKVIHGGVTLDGHAGLDKIQFAGVLDGGKRLTPGLYRLTLSATNAAGSTTAAQHPAFKLLG